MTVGGGHDAQCELADKSRFVVFVRCVCRQRLADRWRCCRCAHLAEANLEQIAARPQKSVNSAAGKNLVGAFHQPALVLIDPELLSTLPTRQLAAGFAEVVKYGLIDDKAFFEFCADNLDSFFGGDPDIRAQAIIRSVQSKARIVAADETERTGTRALLNLGHTFGHALEADTGFSDRLFHGEAVAAGMALAFRYSVRLGLCPAEDAQNVAQLLQRAGLPTTLSEAGVKANGATLVDYMRHDKKMSAGTLPFLLARGIGQTFLSKDVVLDDVAAFLDGEA